MIDLAWGLRLDQRLSNSTGSIDLITILGPDANMLKRRGVFTLGNILHMNAEELKVFPAWAQQSLIGFSELYQQSAKMLTMRVKSGGTQSITNYSTRMPPETINQRQNASSKFLGKFILRDDFKRFCKSILLFSILGPDANILQQNGFKTLGELLLTSPYRIYDLRGMGTTKFDRIFRLISAICENLNDEGEVNWNSIDQKLFHRDFSLNNVIHLGPKITLARQSNPCPLTKFT